MSIELDQKETFSKRIENVLAGKSISDIFKTLHKHRNTHFNGNIQSKSPILDSQAGDQLINVFHYSNLKTYSEPRVDTDTPVSNATDNSVCMNQFANTKNSEGEQIKRNKDIINTNIVNKWLPIMLADETTVLEETSKHVNSIVTNQQNYKLFNNINWNRNPYTIGLSVHKDHNAVTAPIVISSPPETILHNQINTIVNIAKENDCYEDYCANKEIVSNEKKLFLQNIRSQSEATSVFQRSRRLLHGLTRRQSRTPTPTFRFRSLQRTTNNKLTMDTNNRKCVESKECRKKTQRSASYDYSKPIHSEVLVTRDLDNASPITKEMCSQYPVHFCIYTYIEPSMVDEQILPFRRHDLRQSLRLKSTLGMYNQNKRDSCEKDSRQDRRLEAIERQSGCSIRLARLPFPSSQFYRGLPRRRLTLAAKNYANIVTALNMLEERMPQLMRNATFPYRLPAQTSTKFPVFSDKPPASGLMNLVPFIKSSSK